MGLSVTATPPASTTEASSGAASRIGTAAVAVSASLALSRSILRVSLSMRSCAPKVENPKVCVAL
jgi:hypothetical protein